MYQGHLVGQYTGLDIQILAPKKHFSSFLFSVVFNKKYADVAVNDFTMNNYF